MNENEMTNVCIEKVTKEYPPLSFFDSNSFKVLVNSILHRIGDGEGRLNNNQN